MRGLLLALAAAAFEPASGFSWPVLDEPHNAQGLRCYPDHESADLWWYVRDWLALAESGDAPGFAFHRFRYTGSAASGDSGTFWGRGVLGFRVSFAPEAGARERAERALRSRTGRAVRLEALPLERIDASLVYVSLDEGSHGSLPPGDWDEAGSVWRERTYTLGLSAESTELLWEAYHLEGLALSLHYSLTAKGLPTRPARGDREEIEPVLATVAGGAIPIRISPAECPRCFTSTDLDGEIPAGYTLLDVFCHDFQSEQAPADLAGVLVEVRARAAAGGRPIERLRFSPGGPDRQSVRFQFAVRIDSGYSIRVSRLFADGRVEQDAWKDVAGWTGIQDVTAYRRRADAAGSLDPRALY